MLRWPEPLITMLLSFRGPMIPFQNPWELTFDLKNNIFFCWKREMEHLRKIIIFARILELSLLLGIIILLYDKIIINSSNINLAYLFINRYCHFKCFNLDFHDFEYCLFFDWNDFCWLWNKDSMWRKFDRHEESLLYPGKFIKKKKKRNMNLFK